MSLNLEQGLFMQHVAELIRKAGENGLLAVGGELLRTPEQQMQNIKSGRSKTMNSQHLLRLAIDLNFFKRAVDNSLTLVSDGNDLEPLGSYWESLDPDVNTWGGRWSNEKDLNHFERSDRKAGATSALAAAAAATLPLGVQAGDRGAKLISGPVGPRCQNERDDVESVQRLLNLNASLCGLSEALKCDGIIGSKTYTALAQFQRMALGSTEPDSIVKPGDASLLALCKALPEALTSPWLALTWLSAAEAEIALFSPAIVAAMQKYEINTPLRQAHFLAQIGHESGELRFRTELASGAAYEGRRDLGNVQPGDGVRYKGRGLIQLTGRTNYAEYTKTSGTGVDILAQPELVASEEKLCVDVAGWFWERRKINLLADKDNLEGVTRVINGGTNGLADRRRLLIRTKTLMGVA
jgi:predicted chitinase